MKTKEIHGLNRFRGNSPHACMVKYRPSKNQSERSDLPCHIIMWIYFHATDFHDLRGYREWICLQSRRIWPKRIARTSNLTDTFLVRLRIYQMRRLLHQSIFWNRLQKFALLKQDLWSHVGLCTTLNVHCLRMDDGGCLKLSWSTPSPKSIRT